MLPRKYMVTEDSVVRAEAEEFSSPKFRFYLETLAAHGGSDDDREMFVFESGQAVKGRPAGTLRKGDTFIWIVIEGDSTDREESVGIVYARVEGGRVILEKDDRIQPAMLRGNVETLFERLYGHIPDAIPLSKAIVPLLRPDLVAENCRLNGISQD